MAANRTELWLVIVLLVYVFVVGMGSVVMVIVNFPTEGENGMTFPHTDSKGNITVWPFGWIILQGQSFLLIAFLAGIIGSFLHTAQSLSSYIGNQSLKVSWATWYILRPWIGGVLGLAIYCTIRSGLMVGTSIANPHGIVALGLLGGWFSKTTTDKLQEVFDTLFKTDEDKKRKNKLQEVYATIDGIDPSPVPANVNEILVRGRYFKKDVVVLMDGKELPTEYVSEQELKARIDQRPDADTTVSVQVKEPEGGGRFSQAFKLQFE